MGMVAAVALERVETQAERWVVVLAEEVAVVGLRIAVVPRNVGEAPRTVPWFSNTLEPMAVAAVLPCSCTRVASALESSPAAVPREYSDCLSFWRSELGKMLSQSLRLHPHRFCL